jgi:DNA polymerase-3 subunit gamma/tau
MGGARKVYVLDEAHMLSSASWNALLKTLEEPPSYAFFILATTEWHKVPATIVSRCQRFEFKRVQDDVMRDRVEFIAKQEGWKIDEEVAKLIVSRADGCVRDAETLLGQLGGLGEKHLTLDVAQLVIPPGHLPAAAGLVEYWSRRDHVGAINEVQRLADEGLPLLPLFDDLIMIVRKLLVASADPSLADKWSKGTEDERAMVPLIGKFEPGELNDMALLLFERRKDAKSGIDALFALQLAGTIAAGGLLKNAGTVSKPPVAAPVVGSRSEAILSPAPTPVIPAKAGIQPKEEIPESKPEPAPVPKEETETNPPLPVESSAPAAIELNQVRMKWAAIVRAVDEINHSLPFILKISRPEAIQGNTVVIRFQYGFHRDKIITDPRNRKIVEEAIRSVMANDTLLLDGVVGEDAAVAEERSQDIVGNILKAFGGSVVES